jgi:hypothetical protein
MIAASNWINGEQQQECSTMTAAQVVKHLKITKPTVSYLCRYGFLERRPAKYSSQNGPIHITVRSIAAFEKIYVSLGLIVAKHQCRQGALAIKLNNAGVLMLAMPPKYSRIYWKNDIEVLRI